MLRRVRDVSAFVVSRSLSSTLPACCGYRGKMRATRLVCCFDRSERLAQRAEARTAMTAHRSVCQPDLIIFDGDGSPVLPRPHIVHDALRNGVAKQKRRQGSFALEIQELRPRGGGGEIRQRSA